MATTMLFWVVSITGLSSRSTTGWRLTEGDALAWACSAFGVSSGEVLGSGALLWFVFLVCLLTFALANRADRRGMMAVGRVGRGAR